MARTSGAYLRRLPGCELKVAVLALALWLATSSAVHLIGSPTSPSTTSSGAHSDTGKSAAANRTELPSTRETTAARQDVIPVGTTPTGPVYDPANGFVYVPNAGSGNVSVINGTSIVGTIGVGGSPSYAAFDSADDYVYVPNGDRGVAVIGGLTVVATVPVGEAPYAAAFDSQNGDVYVSNFDDGNLSVISGTSVVQNIQLSDCSQCVEGLTYDTATGYVYVVSFAGTDPYAAGQVFVIDGTSIIAAITTGEQPLTVGYDSANGFVYVANHGYRNLTVINGTSVVASITCGESPSSPFFDSANGYEYVPDPGTGNVSVVSGTASVASVTAGPEPTSGAFDPADGLLYVTDLQPAGVYTLDGNASYDRITSFTASPTEAEVNSTTNDSTLLRVSVEGSPSDLTYFYSGLPSGCVSENVSILACTPAQAGIFHISVVVNSTDDVSISAALSLTVAAALDVSSISTRTPTDAGYSDLFMSSASYGVPPYAWSWQFGDGVSSTLATPVHAYALPGSYTAEVWTNDSDGGSAYRSVVVYVFPALQLDVDISNSTIFLGSTIAINANASGGRSPYSYAYTGLPPGCLTSNASSLACLPTQSGTFNVTTSVQDRNGVWANVTEALIVEFALRVGSPSQVTLGQKLTLEVEAEGGLGNLTYNYSGLPPGCISLNMPTLSCIPSVAGSYDIAIRVVDQEGNRASDSVKLEVLGSSSLWSNPWVIGGLATGIAIALVVIVAYARRKGEPPQSTDAYAAYKIPSRTSGPSAEPAELPRGSPQASRSGATGAPNRAEDDSLSDLI